MPTDTNSAHTTYPKVAVARILDWLAVWAGIAAFWYCAYRLAAHVLGIES